MYLLPNQQLQLGKVLLNVCEVHREYQTSDSFFISSLHNTLPLLTDASCYLVSLMEVKQHNE
jgi:hypothetical protein